MRFHVKLHQGRNMTDIDLNVTYLQKTTNTTFTYLYQVAQVVGRLSQCRKVVGSNPGCVKQMMLKFVLCLLTRLALDKKGKKYDLSARCQYTVTW